MIHPTPLSYRLLPLAAALLFVLGGAREVAAQAMPSGAWQPPATTNKHEPIFGIGPRTIWQGGLGFEAGLDRDKSQREESWGIDYHALYGLTSNWAVSADLHQVLDADQEGFSDLMVRSKYRFYRNDLPGGVFHAAVMGGVELPTGATGIGSGSTDGFAGLSGAYEGRRWLAFLTGRYRVNTEGTGGLKRGNVFLYDAALGVRPVKTGYYQPDVVLMGELNGQIFGERALNGETLAGSSGDRLLAGLGAWITYRNWAVKPGLQLPVYNNLQGGDLDYRLVLSVEFHI